MTRSLILILFLSVLFPGLIHAQDQDRDLKLKSIIEKYRQATVRIPYPGRNSLLAISGKISVAAFREKYIDISVSPADTTWFLKQGFDYQIIEDPLTKGSMTSSGVAQAMAWDTYPRFSDYIQILKNFTTTYPDLCRLDTIGFSIYGKLIPVLKITSGVKSPVSKPETFYTSSIHGNETLGFVLMLRFADFLLSNYSSDTRVKKLVDNLQIWINPLANPDGMYGKTDSLLPVPTRRNAHYVDLNRDFPDPLKALDSVRQKETLDMMKFMRKHHFVISANFHSGNEVVNYPWDRWSRLHADNSWFYDISRRYADTVQHYSVPGYMTDLDNGVTNGYDWYQVFGGRQDFVTYELQGRETTIELDYDYVTPVSDLENMWQYNRRSLFGYIENALYGIRGLVTDKVTGKPLKARIYIDHHDRDSSMVYSDTLTGNYTRLIAPGVWTLQFSCRGYYSKTIENVVVSQDQAADLNVELEPITSTVDTVATPVIKIYPDPANTYIKLVFPDRQIGSVTVRIFDSLGRKVADYKDMAIEDTPLHFDVSTMSSGTYSVMITNNVSGVTDKGRFVVIKNK